ncbi:hypothetical protein [Lewinella cohaerens]|uniref:hypothetical protein n=1 Tax=Lewinella cohaerens TaxID=70995 RepID=UPI00037EB68F|nr:hypothetical protein [Lewinella cohaerens]
MMTYCFELARLGEKHCKNKVFQHKKALPFPTEPVFKDALVFLSIAQKKNAILFRFFK